MGKGQAKLRKYSGMTFTRVVEMLGMSEELKASCHRRE